MTGKLELPFDAGITHGLLVYSKRAIRWGAVVLCNFAALALLYATTTFPSLAVGGVAISVLIGLILSLVRIAGFKIALVQSPARFKLVKLDSTAIQPALPEESAKSPDHTPGAGWSLIPAHLGLRRTFVPVLAAASCLLGAVVTTRVLEHRSELLKEQINTLRKNASITGQEVTSLQQRLTNAETAAKDYAEQPRVTITNNTPFPISINIAPMESGTQLKLNLPPGETPTVRVLPGSYRIRASMRGPLTIANDLFDTRVFERGAQYSLTYMATSFAVRTLTVDNETGSTLNIAFAGGRTMAVPVGKLSVQVPAGNYSITVSTRCGSRTDSLTNQTSSVNYRCVPQ